MASELCIALYRPKPGQDDALAALIEGHVPLLRSEGLATDREAILMRSPEDGTFLEVFEWVAPDSSSQAHANEKIGPLWGRMGEVADFVTLADLPEAGMSFPHFTPV